MGWFDSDPSVSQAADQYGQQPEKHEASMSHELLAGAASFEAARAYEQHCDKNGQPQSHEMAKELMAGFAGAFIDREVETRGMDFADKEREELRERSKAKAQQNINENVNADNYNNY